MRSRNNQKYRRQVYRTGSGFSVGPMAAKYLMLMLVAVFSLLYLFQTAQGADKVMEVKQLEKQQTSLDRELTTLRATAGRLQSTDNLTKSATSQGLVPISEVIEPLNPTPASQ